MGSQLIINYFNEVKHFNQLQVCVYNSDAYLMTLIKIGRFNPTKRPEGTPSIVELSKGKDFHRLCCDLQLPWAPVRNHIFSTNHKSLVFIMMMIWNRIKRNTSLPLEIWYCILENTGHEDLIELTF